MSLQELGRRIHANQITLEDALAEMRSGSSSVMLCCSEDDGGTWECSWIVGGERFTSRSYDVRTAVLGAVSDCFKHYGTKVMHRVVTEYGGVVYTDGRPLNEE